MPVRRIVRAALLAAGSLALIAATDASPLQGRRPAPFAHAAARLPAIREALRTAPSEAVLLVGNSHATLAAASVAEACGPLVDAGIGGARVRDYAATLARLPAPARVSTAVLLIGTNDILRGEAPLSPLARARFEAEGASILAWMQARAGQVVVAAVPPIGAAATLRRDPAAVSAYSEILQRLCRAPGCRFADPFAALRRTGDGTAAPEALPDAIHLADYPAMLAALGVCPADRAS